MIPLFVSLVIFWCFVGFLWAHHVIGTFTSYTSRGRIALCILIAGPFVWILAIWHLVDEWLNHNL